MRARFAGALILAAAALAGGCKGDDSPAAPGGDSGAPASDGAGGGGAAGAGGDASGGGDSADARPPYVGKPCTTNVKPGGADVQARVQTALIEAKSGSVVCFDDGVYEFTDELTVNQRGLTIRGTAAGAVWDFRKQRSTARNGLSATGADFAIENLTIKNTAGDGIRVEDTKGVTFRRLAVIWDPDALRKDDAGVPRAGAYAVYPVKCTNVLIEDSEVIGSRDAGLYVGQSTNIIVRRNNVHGNVAGIEIENSFDADVYENNAYDNTAGILVFNLPDLPTQGGKRANVHHNVIKENNRENFALPGTTVAGVPHGVGVLFLAAGQVDLHDNDITMNDSTGVLIVSCFTQNELKACPSKVPYYQWPWGIFIHDNRFSGNGKAPHTLLKIVAKRPVEDILWDGDVDPEKKDDPTRRICLARNGTATFRNVGSRSTFLKQSTDMTPNQCEHPALPPVTL